jgi:hypothetical protein
LGFGVDDHQHLAAENSSDEQAVVLDGYDSILLVEE